MQFINLLILCSCVLIGVCAGAACRGQLPPTEPPRVVDDSPGTSTDDGLGATPVAGIAPPSLGALGGSGGGGGAPVPLPGGTGGQ